MLNLGDLSYVELRIANGGCLFKLPPHYARWIGRHHYARWRTCIGIQMVLLHIQKKAKRIDYVNSTTMTPAKYCEEVFHTLSTVISVTM